MIGFCALVLAHVCVPTQFESALSLRAMYHGPHMDNRNARARVFGIKTGLKADIFLSDFFFYVPTSKVSKACNEVICVYYRRHCETLSCEYVFGDYPETVERDAVMLPKTITISARTPEELRDLQGNLSFVLEKDETANVPVGKLTVADLSVNSPDVNAIRLRTLPSPPIRREMLK